MTGREKILRRLKTQARPADLPAPWQSRRQYQDLSGQFTQALGAAKGKVIQADSLDTALDTLSGVLAELGALKVAANLETPLDEIDLPERFPAQSWYLVDRSAGDLRRFCAEADAGLTSADVALAETGTLVVSSGSGKSRAVSLLPPVHVVLLPASRLRADIFAWTGERPARFPANLVFISGPSKTADIEQTLAVGVHGPKQLIVILYQD